MIRKFIAAAIVLSAAAAHADTFNYSYTFVNGAIVNGTFEGTASGNLVSNLLNITAKFNGVAFAASGALIASSFDAATKKYVASGAQMSFDGTQNNFYIADGSPSLNTPINNWFMSRAQTPGAATNMAEARNNAMAYSFDGPNAGGTYSTARWSLTPVSAVPEPETYAMLLAGLGLIGSVARRRKAKQS